MYTFYQTGGVRECWNCCCGGCDTSRLCTCDIAQFNVFRPGGEEANAVPGNGSMDRVACMMKSKEYEPSGARFVNPADGKGLVANLLDLGKDLAREIYTDADDYMVARVPRRLRAEQGPCPRRRAAARLPRQRGDGARLAPTSSTV